MGVGSQPQVLRWPSPEGHHKCKLAPRLRYLEEPKGRHPARPALLVIRTQKPQFFCFTSHSVGLQNKDKTELILTAKATNHDPSYKASKGYYPLFADVGAVAKSAAGLLTSLNRFRVQV